MFVRNRRELVVDCYPPHRARLLWLLVLLLAGALAWAFWFHLPARVEQASAQLASERIELQRRLSASAGERDRLQRNIDRLQRMQEVNARAYATLQQDFDDVQRRLLELREELAFYESVTTPERVKAGVKVQRVGVRAGGEVGRYIYTLVLVQSGSAKKTVEGSLHLSLAGLQEGVERVLDITASEESASAGTRIRFRYFQNVAGVMQLPAGFEPRRLDVSLDLEPPRGDLSQRFDWQDILE